MDTGSQAVTDEVRRAYEHILFHPDWTASALADATGLSTGEVDALVRELTGMGLLRQSQEQGERLIAVPPSVGMGRLLLHNERRLQRQTEQVHHLRESMLRLIDRFEEERRGQADGHFETLRGRDQVVGRIAELMDRAEHEVWTVVTSPPSPTDLEAARRGDEALLRRGVSVRALYLQSHHRNSAPLRDYLTWMRDQGSSVRIANDLPLRFMVLDQTTAVVALSRDPKDGAAVVQLPGLVTIAARLFEALWDKATIPTNGPAEDHAEGERFTDAELAVLRILATGCKDEAVSRRTGMSLRSVRRTIANLSRRLGARSRFELGVLCVERDLVSARPDSATKRPAQEGNQHDRFEE